MKVPLSWLKEKIATQLSPTAIGEMLTNVGVEVDSIKPTPLGFEGVVVAKVLSIQPHPQADKLVVAQVSDGSETFQVVCGASNCRAGILTAFAKIGARLTDEKGQTFEIKQTQLRGIDSSGMLCGHDELGVPKGEEQIEHGIIELNPSLSVGTNLHTIYGDLIFDVSLTPNLVHCASIHGVARELSAISQEPLHTFKSSVVENSSTPISEQTSIRIENSKSCPRYACRLITGVQIKPSPEWLKTRIEACGMRSVNNVVDITNLVLLELGHPLHAFDFDTLHAQQIVVRNAHNGEKITTLDGKEHFLTEEILVVCDKKAPVAIAGVMGSSSTEVSSSTQTILLESAYFEPQQVRRAAKHLGIHTEASYRFERGTDPNAVLVALERATALICELAEGTALQGTIDIQNGNFEEKKLSCRLSRINKLLGTQLALSEVETIFSRLNFKILSTKEDCIEVLVPTYRQDMHQEIDLVEEVARLYGFDHIHPKQKALYRTGNLPHSAEYLFEKKVAERLLTEGLQEFVTCDLISPQQADLIDPDCFPSRALIKLLNPHSVDQSVLRPSLLPGMLAILKYNADHAIESVSGFEIGRVHFRSKDTFLETPVLSIVLTGERAQPHWESKKACVDFFDLKGLVENLLDSLKISDVRFIQSQYSNFHPGRQARVLIDGLDIGVMGEIHPKTLQKGGLHTPVYYAELNLEDIATQVPQKIKMTSLPQFPSSSRDWTITIPDHIRVGLILEKIKNFPSNLLESISLLDVYRSDKLGSDQKNVTFRFVYRNFTKTVSVSDVESEHKRIIENISETLREEPS